MTDPFAHVDGHALERLELHVPNVGPWWADVDFGESPGLEGAVTIHVGDAELAGTVRATESGAFGLQQRCRVVAGADGWHELLEPKAYHSDSGVQALTVAQDAARAVGESLGTFSPASGLGRDYVRQSGPAARVLEDVAGGVPWYVDYQGTTHVAERPETALDDEVYEVLTYQPRERLARLTVDDLSKIGIGSVLTRRLDEPQTVRDLEVVVQAADVQVTAWTGGTATGMGRLAGALRAFVERATDGQLWGSWRYRVVEMWGDRVKLQAVRKVAGLPDVLPVEMWPGAAGAWADMTPGAEVLVEFIEGDRTMPVVTAFAAKGGPGFVPATLVFDATDTIKLGASATKYAALADDVESELSKIKKCLDAFAGKDVTPANTYYTEVGSVGASKVKAE